MKDNVCILIPTLNEAPTIGDIVRRFKSMGFSDVLVIDGHSTDDTVKIAEDAGARVVIQDGKGKGQALQQAFNMIDKDVIVMIDGDGTYLPEEVNRLLEPIEKSNADHVIGNRFASPQKGAFTTLNRFGNKILSKAFGFAYGAWITDVLSGYRAFTRRSIKELELNKTGFETEAEITIEGVKKNQKIVEVPVTYLPRHVKAVTKLNPLSDGLKIGHTMYQLTKTHNPLLYFGLFGILFMILGVAIGVYVVLEWFKGIEHIPLTILSTLLVITGVQTFIFGLLCDILALFHKEMMREIKKR